MNGDERTPPTRDLRDLHRLHGAFIGEDDAAAGADDDQRGFAPSPTGTFRVAQGPDAEIAPRPAPRRLRASFARLSDPNPVRPQLRADRGSSMFRGIELASRAPMVSEQGIAREQAVQHGDSRRAEPLLLVFLRERYLSVDTRWLGVFRVALGTLLMIEVLRRWHYAVPFYTNDGLLPNHFSLFAPMGSNVFSIYHAFSTYGEVSVAFLATLLIFFAFTLGYRTRLFHLLSALCITSLNARNLFVQNGGTIVVNILTVYSLFLPLGARLSLDAIRTSLRRRHDASVIDLNGPDASKPPERANSVVVLLFLLQWSAIYFFNTIQKDGEGWS